MLAATEGVSVGAHRIHRASLRESVIITAVNICDSYVGVSNIDHPTSAFLFDNLRRSGDLGNTGIDERIILKCISQNENFKL
jgi:hypothetical protein